MKIKEAAKNDFYQKKAFANGQEEREQCCNNVGFYLSYNVDPLLDLSN